MEIAAGEYNYDVWQARKCWKRKPLMFCRLTPRAAASPDFCKWRICARHFKFRFPRTPRPRCTRIFAAPRIARSHVEYFHDHVRIEQMFFDGATTKHKNGFLQPDLFATRAWLGIQTKRRRQNFKSKYERNTNHHRPHARMSREIIGPGDAKNLEHA